MSVLSNLELSKAKHGASDGKYHLGVGFEGNYSQSESWESKGSDIYGHNGQSQGQVVQVAPQRISLKLRASKIVFSLFCSVC